MTVLSLYLMTVCRDGDSPSPNLLSTYCRRKLDNNVIIKISEVKKFSCVPHLGAPSCPQIALNLRREDESRARGSRILLCTGSSVSSSPIIRYRMPGCRLSMQHVSWDWGCRRRDRPSLGTTIAPSSGATFVLTVLTTHHLWCYLMYLTSVLSAPSPSPVPTYSLHTVEGSWILLSYSRLPSSNLNSPFALCALNAAISRGDAPRE